MLLQRRFTLTFNFFAALSTVRAVAYLVQSASFRTGDVATVKQAVFVHRGSLRNAGEVKPFCQQKNSSRPKKRNAENAESEICYYVC